MLNNQQIRSFIAIELPEEVKSGLLQLQNELKVSGHNYIKWVAPEGIHLTIKFLGNISSHRVSDVTKAMEEAGRMVSAFQLKIGELGAFPNLRRPRVIWVGIGGELDKLAFLQQRIDNALIPLGFPKEKRPFSPHITLARIREKASFHEQRDFGELIARTSFEAVYNVEVNVLSLMRSQLLPGGAVYSRLAFVNLKALKAN